AGKHRADGEAARGRPIKCEAEHCEEHHADYGDRGILSVQIGLGASLDGGGDFLHALAAGRLFVDPAESEQSVEYGEYAGADREPQRDISGHEAFPPLAGLLFENVSLVAAVVGTPAAQEGARRRRASGRVSGAHPRKKARDYTTKVVLSFLRTGMFFRVTYCGRPSL